MWNPWSLPSALAFLLMSGLLVFVALRRPPAVLWPTLPLMLFATLLWAGAEFTTFYVSEPATYQVVLMLLFSGVMLGVVSWWRMSLRLAEAYGQPLPWARRPWTWLPVAWMTTVWLGLVTNPWHGLFVEPRLGAPNVYHGLWWAFALAGWTLNWWSVYVFAWLLGRVRSSHTRRNLAILTAATVGANLTNLGYVFSPVRPPFDPTAIAVCVGSGLFIWGIYGTRLFALRPFSLPAVLRHQREGVVVLDRGGRLLYANPAARALLEPPPLTIDADAYEVLARPAGVSPATLRAQLEQGSPPEGLAYRWGERSIRLRAADIPGVRGRLVGRSVQVEDETALAQQAALLDVILANSDEGILVTDPAGHILYHNVGFAEIWGIPSSLLARGVAHEIVAAAREQIRDPTHTPVNLDSALVRGEHTFTLRDGRIVETYSRPIPGPGPLLGRVWYTRDVSERRRTEQALFEAQKFESLGVMAGGIAHDFNNLLLCVLGNAALALDTLAEDAPVRALLEDVSAAAQRAGDLTRQLLAYAGRGHFEMEPLDLSPLVREVTDLLRATIPRHVKLEYDLAADLPGVMADPSQMRQIVMNLALNAADAIGDEPGSIRLTTRELKLEGAAVVALEVRDSGCGMDEETRRRIFDPFFTTKASGRGLGLAAVLGIVHAHQGQVWAETAPGEGSCFSVLLPSRGVRARPTAAPTPSAGWRSEGTVLVADDDPRVLRLTERILASAGFEVLLAGDGTAALELFRDRRHRIRAVVLDLAMPGVDGLEVWRVLRAEAPELPVVVSSGFPEEEALERLGGRFHFLQKPYPPGRLLERLRRALEGP